MQNDALRTARECPREVRHFCFVRLGYVMLALGATVFVACERPTPAEHRLAGLSTIPVPSIEPTPPWPSPATTVDIAWLPPTVRRHRGALEAAAVAHTIDAELLAIVTLVESGGWVGAVSPTGARGLMQVMPATAGIIATERRLPAPSPVRLSEPAVSVDFGAYYLQQQLAAFATPDVDESVSRAAGAYNGGPTAFRRFLEQTGELSDQTKRYRGWVGGMWRERRQATSPTFARWRAAGGDRLLEKAAAESLPAQ